MRRWFLCAPVVLVTALLTLTGIPAVTRALPGGRRRTHLIKAPKTGSTNGTRSAPLRHRFILSYDHAYTIWTPWSRCSRKCRQRRTRTCKDPEICGTNVRKEARVCFVPLCTDSPYVVVGEKSVEHRGRVPHKDLSLLPQLQDLLYSGWTAWSSCTRTCRSRRIRKCEMMIVCGRSRIREEAFCYVEGTDCHQQHLELMEKKRKRQEAKQGLVSNQAKWSDPNVSPRCGISKIKPNMALRIIGGRESVKGSWPWQVAVLNRDKEPFCGGTLLAPQWVVTAAHCVRRRMHVRAGEHDVMETEGSERETRVAEAFIHPNYDVETVNNDVALLYLRDPLKFGRYLQPVCLPESGDQLPPKAMVTILGWGKRRNSAVFGTDVLHQAEVPVVNTTTCRKVYEDYYISDAMLCAGYRRGRVDSCAGDSGGPLLYRQDGRWTLFGITSFGEGCGRRGKFGIYAKVARFVKWIRRIIEKNSIL